MGLFGNLFTESDTTKNIERLMENNTNLRNEIINVNKNISSQVANVMMKSMQEMAADQEITQEIKIKGITAQGNVTINNIRQNVKVKVNLSALQNTELQNEMLEKIQSNLSQGLKEAIANVQTKEAIKGEQWVSEIAGLANNIVQAVAGGNLNENIKETTRNTLNSENIQKTINEIESNVESNINNETMSKIAASFAADQKIEISDIEAGGNATISNVGQDVLAEQLLKSVQDSGATSKLLSNVLGISESFTEKVIKQEQTDKTENKSTLSGIADIFSGAFSGTGGIILGIVSMVFSSIVGAVGYMFLSQQGKMQTQLQRQMIGGGKILPDFFLNLFKFTKLSEFQILLVLAIAILLFMSLRENFTKTENVVLKHDGKYLYPNGDKLCLTGDKQIAGKFNLKVINVDGQPNTVLLNIDDKYLRQVGDELLFRHYELFDKEMHDFKINKLSDTTFELSKNDQEQLVIKDDCLTIDKTSTTKFLVELE